MNENKLCNLCNESHEVVYCIKCNIEMNPCDVMPNPIEYGTNYWICEECFKIEYNEGLK